MVLWEVGKRHCDVYHLKFIGNVEGTRENSILLQESYLIKYELIGMREVRVEYIQVG